MIKLFKILFCLNLLPCLAQLPDPRSQAWADLPDTLPDPTFRIEKAIPLVVEIKCAETRLGLTTGRIELGDTLFMPVNNHSYAEVRIPLTICDDIFKVYSLGYHPLEDSFLNFSWDKPYLLIELHKDVTRYPVPDQSVFDLATIATACDSMPFSVRVIGGCAQGYWNDGESNDEEDMYTANFQGDVYAPLGMAICSPKLSEGWQFRLNQKRLQNYEEIPSDVIMEGVDRWQEADLYFLAGRPRPEGWVQEVIGQELFGKEVLAKARYQAGLHHGFVWLNAAGLPVVQKDTLEAEDRLFTQEIQYVHKHGRPQPFMVVQRNLTGTCMECFGLYFDRFTTQSPLVFRGRMAEVLANSHTVSCQKEYWENFIFFDYW